MTDLLVVLLSGIGPYGWFVLGAVLLTAETLLPGVSLIWFGLAATAVGLLELAMPIAWETQVVAFLGFAAMAVLIGRLVGARRTGDDADRVNRGAATLIGRELVLCEPIVAGAGRAAWGDTVWRVRGPECPAGARVRVTGADAATLLVEPVAAASTAPAAQ